MAEITCEIVRDLLPLYVDDVLSADSKNLVEEHIASCAECKAYYEMLQEPSASLPQRGNTEGKEALQKIKKKINRKRITAICLTAVLAAAIVGGLYYGIMLNEHYMPYEKTGIYVEDGIMKAKSNYYAMHGFNAPGGETEFLYLTDTIYTRNNSNEHLAELFYLNEDGLTTEILDNYFNVERTITTKEIYYVPKEYAKLLSQQKYWTNGITDETGQMTEEEMEAEYQRINQEELEELKEASVLLWSAE